MTNRLKDKILAIIPFIMLLATGISAIVSSTVFYRKIYMYLGDSVGYSIITNIWFLLLYSRKNFCIQTKIAVYGLLIMNIISIIFTHNNWMYNQVYDLWITIITLIVVTISLFKWKH